MRERASSSATRWGKLLVWVEMGYSREDVSGLGGGGGGARGHASGRGNGHILG